MISPCWCGTLSRMEITPAQFTQIEHCLPLQRGNVSLPKLNVLNAQSCMSPSTGASVMTRGCASRLLILSANGNLRALLSGLIFAVTAQASRSGSLTPLRDTISAWWTMVPRATCWPSPAQATGADFSSGWSGLRQRSSSRREAAGASGNGWAASARA